MEQAMRSCGKKNVLGIMIDALDYDAAVDRILHAAHQRRGFAVSALAVHGLMTGALDPEQKFRLNHFDLLTPDGQPVRWVLNWLYRVGLRDRVYGPNLTLRVCARAAEERVKVYFYGSSSDVLAKLRVSLLERFPNLIIAGTEPSQFRRLTPTEKKDLSTRIRESGASIIFVGLGCPRQEVFAFECREALQIPILAVGAAFPFLAGQLPQAPKWIQNAGLEWLFRLMSEPKRLWRRYMFLNPAYMFLITLQAIGIRQFSTQGQRPTEELLYG
jgi:N-acetylglucosaminyldiphosphoundecaprenol N-acetyl-beta-D-mannosaminyltransferase